MNREAGFCFGQGVKRDRFHGGRKEGKDRARLGRKLGRGQIPLRGLPASRWRCHRAAGEELGSWEGSAGGLPSLGTGAAGRVRR